jgi:hypothetical protein
MPSRNDRCNELQSASQPVHSIFVRVLFCVSAHLERAFCHDFSRFLVPVAALGEALLLRARQAGARLCHARLETLVSYCLIELLHERRVHFVLDLASGCGWVGGWVGGCQSVGRRRCGAHAAPSLVFLAAWSRHEGHIHVLHRSFVRTCCLMAASLDASMMTVGRARARAVRIFCSRPRRRATTRFLRARTTERPSVHRRRVRGE